MVNEEPSYIAKGIPVSTPENSAAVSPVAKPDEWTVQRILEWTTNHLTQHGSESPRLDAEILLAHSRGCARIELYTRFAEVLTDEERATMRELVKRRAKAEPVAYLVGHKEFYNLSFQVTADVLIPRPDTETLVMETLSHLGDQAESTILEIGTGSGCIPITLAKRHSSVRITSVDISEAASDVAKSNAETHEVADRIDFQIGDLFSPLESGTQFDLIVSNPPYIKEDDIAELDPDVRLHEPHLALNGGADGLDVIRRLIETAPQWLKPGGWLLFEIGEDEGNACRELFTANGSYTNIQIIKDLNKHDRVAKAQLA